MPVVACPQCGTKLDAPDSVLGKEVVCGQCGNRFVAAVAEPPGAEPSPAAAPEPPMPVWPEPAPPDEPPAAAPPAPPVPMAAQPPPVGYTPPPEPGAPPPGAPPTPGPVASGIPPLPPPGRPAYGPGFTPPPSPYGGPQKPSGNATAALTLGIVSLVGGCCCWPAGLICSILAIVFASKAMSEIASGVADPASAGKANAGRICGIISLILCAISVIYWIIRIGSGKGPFEVDF